MKVDNLDPLINELRQLMQLLHERATIEKQRFIEGKALTTDAFRPLRDAGFKLGSIGTTSTVLTRPLQPGLYHFAADTDMFIEIGPTPVAQVDASYFMWGGTVVGPIQILEGDLVAAITNGGTNANLWMKPVK